MQPDVSELLAYLQSSGFRDIAGSRISARIPISRSLLNRVAAQALEATNFPVRDVDIRPHAGDQFDVVITLSWRFVPPIKIAFKIEKQPQFPESPVLVLRWSLLGGVGTLASPFISALGRLPDGVRLQGDRLALDVSELAARSPGAMLFPYIRALGFHTIDDWSILELDLEVPAT